MKKAFTLVELLVVIGIIALLVALLLPAINKAKSVGQKVACINNQKQLQMAHTMFSDDHGDKILYSSAWKYEKCAPYAWMSGSLNLSQYGNRTAWLKRSPLFTYVGSTTRNNTGVFKCPADKDMVRVTNKQRNVLKELIPRHRSYSVNIHVGGWSGWPVQKDREWRIYHKQQDIENPSNIFTFIEMPFEFINAGCFRVVMNEGAPTHKVYDMDVPGNYHIDGSNFKYGIRRAYGSVDVKWLKDRSTTKIENFKEQRYTWFPWVHGLSRQVRKWNVRENPIGYDYFVSGNGRKDSWGWYWNDQW